MALPMRQKAKPDVSLEKMDLDLNIDMADIILEYTISNKPLRNHQANLKQLLSVADLNLYRSNYDISDRINLAKAILDLKLNEGVTKLPLIKEKLKESRPDLTEIISTVNWDPDSLNPSDCRIVTDWIEQRMQFYFFYIGMPDIIKTWETCYAKGFKFNQDALRSVNEMMSQLVVRMKNTEIMPGIMTSFNFAAPDAAQLIKNSVKKLQKPTAILQTGIRNLNSLLGPGFRGSKLYTILGMSGRFKSGTLLNIADQITKFNPSLEHLTSDGKRNTLLFVTLENTIDETLERMYNMYADDSSDFLRTDPDEVVRVLKEEGKFCFDCNDGPGISIEFRYFPGMSITTTDLYRVIDDMEQNNKHVIGLILDYIKIINSAYNHNGDETLRVTYVAKELKALANHYDIPVITAQQINRMGNATIDSAMREGKQDLIRLVGNSDIAGAWGVVEESDWVAIINLEKHVKTGKIYWSIKRTKNRCGKCDMMASDYFNHPFANGRQIRLDTDVDKDASISIMSMASDLESVDMSKYEENDAQKRPVISFTSNNKQSILHAMCG